jgi:hypothetical protein
MAIFGLDIAPWAQAAASAWALFISTDRGAMASLSDEERRVLQLLAGRSDGCDEAVLLADGVTVGQLAGLVIDGFATGSVARIALDGREKPVVWMKITQAGRQVIAE